MGALIPLLLPLVPALINGVESLFQKKPKSGTDKLSAALQALQAIVSQMVAAKVPLPDGTIPTTHPTDDALAGLIETVLAQMRASGQLGQQAPAAGTLYLLQGSVTALK